MTKIKFKKNQETTKHINCDSVYQITYKTKYSCGYMNVKTSVYQEYIKKFEKVFKDVEIVSLLEIKAAKV